MAKYINKGGKEGIPGTWNSMYGPKGTMLSEISQIKTNTVSSPLCEIKNTLTDTENTLVIARGRR